MAEPSGLRLFLCGDVMTGRGIDQILPHPSDPALHEDLVRDARDYVRLAERASGPIPRNVDPAFVWGDALEELELARPDLRVANLETAVTTSPDYWPGKAVNYRMHPDNVGCLTAARIDCCCLANNHVMDWGRQGLAETLDVLDRAGIARAGAGRDEGEAASWAAFDLGGKGRVLVASAGSVSSGIPPEWAAGEGRPGVNLLEASPGGEEAFLASIRDMKATGAAVVASVHWGGNWGYDIPREQRRLAHALVDAGADVVHGHSSHHPKGLEVYRDRLILHGCGDFLNDYEGITGYETYRPQLALMVFPLLEPGTGRLLQTRLVPMRLRGFRLERLIGADVLWLHATLDRASRPQATRVLLHGDGTLSVRAAS